MNDDAQPVRAPERLHTPRLFLRRPQPADAPAIFDRYASDPEVVRYVGWPRHRSPDDTRQFLEFSDAEWTRWPAGPYLAFAGDVLVGGTGFAFEHRWRAMTGYVLARDAWGRGYATEMLEAVVRLAPTLRVRRLFAYCHADHRPSWRVLEKGGLTREGRLRAAFEFPNLAPGEPQDVFIYATVFPLPS